MDFGTAASGLYNAVTNWGPSNKKSNRGITRIVPYNRTGALMRRVNHLSKSLKVANPHHMYQWSASASIPATTAGTLLDLSSGLAQGDQYNQRFANHVDLSRLVIKGPLVPGSSASMPTVVRITVIRGSSGLAFAANLTGSYNPIADGTVTRLLYDRFYNVAPAQTNQGFATNVYINIKLRHRQKFTGANAGTQTGESLYLICQSDKASTAAGATWNGGVVELYFKP